MFRGRRPAQETYPGSDILVNKMDIDNSYFLEKKERELSNHRLLELAHRPVRQSFNTGHLQRLHRYIFQDVYDWAGDLRTIRIQKGNLWFIAPEGLRDYLKTTFAWLKVESHLLRAAVDQERFVDEAALLFYRLNRAHPFREGNGRTQRVFLQNVAAKSNRELDWNRVSSDTMLGLSIDSLRYQDHKKIHRIIKKVLLNSSDL